MSNFSSLRAAIQQYIKTNGNEEITGAVLQDILLSMVSVLGDTAINDLETALQTETTNRTNADGTLQQNITAEGNARQQADTALGGRIDGLQSTVQTISTMLGEGYLYAGLATTSTDPGTPSGKVFYIATAAGTYTNFSGIELTFGINILKYNGSAWSSEQVLAIDDVPTAGSNNLIKSGGVYFSLAKENTGNISLGGLDNCKILDNTWVTSSGLETRSNSQILIFRAKPNDIFYVKSQSSKYATIAFANEDLNSITVNSIDTNTSSNLSVPSDHPYVIIGLKYNNGDRKPEDIRYNGVNLKGYGFISNAIREVMKSSIYTVHIDGEASASRVWHQTNIFTEPGDVIYVRKRTVTDGDYEIRFYDGTLFIVADNTWKAGIVTVGGRIRISSPGGSITTSFDIDITMKNPNGVYVSPTGDDTNTGTIDSPVASINKAIELNNNIILRGGQYENVQIDLSKFDNQDIRITAYPAEKPILMNRSIIVAANEETKTTGYTNIYQKVVADPSLKWIYQHMVDDVNTAIDDAETHPLQRGLFYRCDCTKIERLTFGSGGSYTTLAEALTFMDSEVSNHNYYYVYSDGTMYFTRPETVTADHQICCSAGSIIMGQNNNNRLHITGVSFYYGSLELNNVDNSEFSDCSGKYGIAGDCFRWYNCKNLTFRKCEAARSQHGDYGDGFGGNADIVVDPKTASVYLLDCWSHDNYDDGYSDHGGCNINIYGGLYEYNGKGGTTPSFGSHCCGRDILSRHNRYGIYYTGFGEQQDPGKNGNATFFNCVAHNNREHGFFVSADGDNVNTMYCYNCISFNNISYGYRGRIYAYNCKTYNNVAGDKYGNVVVQTLSDLQ